MRFALSTNWCNRRLQSGEEIADKALELGFDALELGFHTTPAQVAGFKSRLDRMPVGSVHAFCPVPISAPQGYPELYQLASFDAEMRRMAQLMIRRNLAFAAEMGARALVLHAGRVSGDSAWLRFVPERWAARLSERRRVGRGRRMADVLRRELESLVPELERLGVRLGLENLPYREGFPDATELAAVTGDWVRPWWDTGHAFAMGVAPDAVGITPLGMHLNDSNGGDDHLAPGEGKIDFAAYRPMMEVADHLVFEPNPGVTEARLRQGLERMRSQ